MSKKSKRHKSRQENVVIGIPDTKRVRNKIAEHQKKTDASKPVLPGSWKLNAGIFLLLIGATLVFYSGDLHLGFFAVDDPQYVINNPWIRGMSLKNLSFILSNPYFANYSPLHLFSYMIDYMVAGPTAYAFHLSSNLWAGIVAGFVFLVAFALTENRIVAIASAILFIVHPVHVEAVAWISSRKDLVAAAFALPSMLAYLRYRRGGNNGLLWYFLSLLLFLFALGGKLSVATFPVVFLAIDYFLEKRPLSRSFLDKIPYIVLAGIIAMVVTSAQPQMGNRTDAFVLASAALQNMWLLSGFGSYVLYRVAPESSGTVLQLAGLVVLLLMFVAPLLLRRRLPLLIVLIYWLLFTFIPSQVLSFTHPVTDRYLFFPSVAMVILIAWGIVALVKKLKRFDVPATVLLILAVTFFWARTSLIYLKEWSDPRSVWYAATKKSSDPTVPQNLGSYYVEMTRRLGVGSRETPLSKDEKQRLASSVWADDPRLPKLFSEWSAGENGGSTEKEFLEQLQSLALEAFEKSLQLKSNRVMPALYYNKGLILLDRGDLSGAKKEFLATIDEAAKETFAEVRQQLTVYCHADLAIIEWRSGNYPEALKWFRLAEEEQIRYGGNWMPNLTANRKKMEEIIASQPAK